MIEQEPYPGHAEEQRKREELKARIERAHSTVLPGALRGAFGGGCVTATIPKGDKNKTVYQLQPITLGLTANLERIKSPLLEVVRVMREVFSADLPAQPPTENADSVPSLSPGLNRASDSTLGNASKDPAAEPEAARSAKLKSGDLDARFKLIKQKVSELKFEEEQIAETVFIFVRPQKVVRKLLERGRPALREAAMEELGDKLHPTQMAALQRACSQHYVASFATIIGYGVPPPEGEGHAMSFPPPSPSEATGSVGG